MKNKKGAMELSVNAIIIVVIAVIVMGFIISFLSGAWTTVTSQLEERLSQEAEPATASLSNPITLSKEKIVASPGDDAVLKVAIFNTDQTNELVDVYPEVTCTVLTGVSSEFNAKTIVERTSASFGGLVEIPSDASSDTYLCSVNVVDASGSISGYSGKDLIIEVK